MSYYYCNDKSNTYQESEYFSAYLVTQPNAASLQSLIDTHDKVRLGPGDYSAAGNITLSSNQSLYGWYIPSDIGGNITIEQGSTNVTVTNTDGSDVTFEAGTEISNCLIKNIQYGDVITNNGRVVNCEFFNLNRVHILFDCSTSGYVRGNLFYRVTSQNSWPQTIIKGNGTDDSYGNIEIFRNFLFPNGDGGEYNTLLNHTIIATDAETWNNTDAGTKGCIYARGVGTLKIASINAYVNGPYDTLPAVDTDGDLIISGARIEDNPSNLSQVQAGGNLASFYSRDQTVSLATPGSSFSITTLNHNDGEVLVEGTNRTTLLTGTDLTNTQSLIKGASGDKIGFRLREFVKPATGENWASDRVGKTDQSSTIQALIDSNGVAELDEGVYYIGSTLSIDDGKGIVGKGKGKTVIVGITDDFPLVEHVADTSGGLVSSVEYVLSNLTLQGGEVGFRTAQTGDNNFQISFSTFSDLEFRDQTYGMHLDRYYGFDNVFFDTVSFVNCTIGFFQDPNPDFDIGGGETFDNMYVDKTLFHKCEFIDCGTGMSMLAERPNNTNVWTDCYFSGNVNNVNLNNCYNNVFINTKFTLTSGDYIVGGNNFDIVGFYGCSIYNNSVTRIFDIRKVSMEDCTITGNTPLMETANENQAVIFNCNITGTLGDMDEATLINSNINGDTGLSKELVRVTSSVPTTLIDVASSPYPQLLIR